MEVERGSRYTVFLLAAAWQLEAAHRTPGIGWVPLAPIVRFLCENWEPIEMEQPTILEVLHSWPSPHGDDRPPLGWEDGGVDGG